MADHRPILIGEFYIKRFLRIIPVYLVVLTLYFTVPMLRETEGIQPLWKFLTFTENLGFDGQVGRAFSHAWSLCVEEHFYLVFPIIVAGLSLWNIGRSALWIAVAVLLAGIVIRVLLWHSLMHSDDAYGPCYRYIYYPTYSRLDGLLVGVCAATIQSFAPRISEGLTNRSTWLLTAGTVLLLVSLWVI